MSNFILKSQSDMTTVLKPCSTMDDIAETLTQGSIVEHGFSTGVISDCDSEMMVDTRIEKASDGVIVGDGTIVCPVSANWHIHLIRLLAWYRDRYELLTYAKSWLKVCKQHIHPRLLKVNSVFGPNQGKAKVVPEQDCTQAI